MYLSPRKKLFVDTATSKFGVGAILNRQEVQSAADDANIPFPWWFWKTAKVGYNQFQLPSVGGPETVVAPMTSATPVASSDAQVNLQPAPKVSLSVETTAFTENLVPAVDPLFVPFGNFTKIKQIITSKMFYPVYVTGLSGNGKTFGIEQACAQARREVIRINFTVETDEDDLIGGFRLIDGDTKFFKGPIINAMQKGAVALLDELDLANPAKVMCLQSILEGKGYFIKKTGEFIKPAPGFTVIATANTKGKGSDDGRFIGTNVMNEAFLERFPITVEQEYPPVATEKKILGKVFTDLGITDDGFVAKLVDWADIIRKTFYDGGVDEIISTRRLVHIAKAFSIFSDKMTAIDMCINRFDEDTKLSFKDLYTKIDADVPEAPDTAVENEEEIPF
tara:strand:- start:590 stop:1768 length:1179 start_codon:yes stop_codon:yes gene_type:complete